ncbi:MFS transporter [Saccharopolyspora taberi]|uniref:MFS transporter n=1 Tax=Saccharopolyspora taberi TaxID=60895 RepID=A0ABN3V316_9PSEU
MSPEPMTPDPITPDPRTPAPRREFGKIVAASLAGTTIEFYDFFLYGSAAALVFNKVFFPAGDPVTGVLLALVTYAVGFLARPVGGVLFGHLGDRMGRRRTLALSLLMMGGATVAIGLIPSYQTIGVLAPILLTLLRLVQGVALGGEWGGAILLVTEHADSRRRGFWASWPQTGGPLGNLLATGVLALMGLAITDAAFVEWGWRLPFVISAILVLVGLWLRRAVQESPLFAELQAAGRADEGKAPISVVLRHHRREVALATLANVGEKTTYYVFSIFLLSYLAEQLHLPKGVGLTAIAIGSVFQVAAMLVGGALSDRFGRRGLNIGLALLIAVWGFAGLPLVDGGDTATITLVVIVGLTLHGLMTGAQVAFFAELFPSEVRYTGASLGYQLATVLGGSLAPIIGVGLMHRFGSTLPVGVFLAVAELCTLVAFLLAGETSTRALRDLESV